jgi:hypothetical protein
MWKFIQRAISRGLEWMLPHGDPHVVVFDSATTLPSLCTPSAMRARTPGTYE